MEGKKLPISLCMIVKNEEKFLADCLRSVQGFVSEMVIVDTGSTDRTVEIAKEFGCKVVHYEWKNDFAEARNISLENATYPWILQLDADEEVFGEDISWFYDTYPWIDYDGYVLDLHNTKVEGSDEVSLVHKLIRFFRNSSAIRYQYQIHENIMIPSGLVGAASVRLLHKGYSNNETNKRKAERNFSLLKQQITENPKDPMPHYYLAQCYEFREDQKNAFQAAFSSVDLGATFPIRAHALRICFNYAIQTMDVHLFLQLKRRIASIDSFPELPFFEGLLKYKLGLTEEGLASIHEFIAYAEQLKSEQKYNQEEHIVSGTMIGAYELLYKHAYEMKQYDNALTYMNKLLEESPSSYHISAIKARLFLELKDLDNAIKSLEEVLEGMRILPEETRNSLRGPYVQMIEKLKREKQKVAADA